MGKKQQYLSAERNKKYILEVLQKHFDATKPAVVLEISSGTGQHVSYFAQHFPNFIFYPSEFDLPLLDSIKSYAEDTPTKNVMKPIGIDVTRDIKTWNLPFEQCDYLININMMHITLPACTVGLFQNGSKVLKPGAIMVTYGPYAHNGIITPQSNINFNIELQSLDSRFGLKDIVDLKKIAESYDLKLIKVHDLPANNKCLIWQKKE